MAQISFSQAIQAGNSKTNSNTPDSTKNYPQVSFLALKNDGDRAYVRFLLDNESEMEILSTHEVTVNGKIRKVNCLNTGDKMQCPLCLRNAPTKNKVYIKLIEYVKNANGGYDAFPKVWERPISFLTQTMRDHLEDYKGEISSVIFRITRAGASGSASTTYSVTAAPPKAQAEMDPLCPLNKDLFKNYHALGTLVLNKSASDIVSFLETGTFPVVKKEETTSNNAVGDMNKPSSPSVVDTARAASRTTFTGVTSEEDIVF